MVLVGVVVGSGVVVLAVLVWWTRCMLFMRWQLASIMSGMAMMSSVYLAPVISKYWVRAGLGFPEERRWVQEERSEGPSDSARVNVAGSSVGGEEASYHD
jgi:hypothetical protein